MSLTHISEPTRPDQGSYAGFCMKKKRGDTIHAVPQGIEKEKETDTHQIDWGPVGRIKKKENTIKT